MPIVLQKEVAPKIKLAVWDIIESTDELMNMVLPVDQKALSEKLLDDKRREMLATRILLRDLVGPTYEGIIKDEHGKPFLINHPDLHVSISHAFPMASAILDTGGSTGIDLEAPREKIHRIKHKFLSETEVEDDTDRLTILWAAKECLYKIYGRRKLLFKEHLAVEFLSQDLLKGTIQTAEWNQQVDLRTEKIGNHWLVYKKS